MAEFVDFRTEEMIPELEELERLRIFEDREIRAIVKSRKNFEYKIQKQTKCKDDFIKYIEYEMDLLKLVRIRKNKLGLNRKPSDLDINIANRVNKLFKKAIFQFHDDIRLWLSYIRFCEKIPAFSACVGYMLVGMLSVHSHKPQLWKLAATWEFEHNGSVENARHFLLRGLKHHPDSKILYMEAFRLELMYTSMKRKQTDEGGQGGGGGSGGGESKRGSGNSSEAGASTSSSSVATLSAEMSMAAASVMPFIIPGSSGVEADLGIISGSDMVSALRAWGGADIADSCVASGDRSGDCTSTDPVLEGRLAEFIYESASKRIPDVSFLIGLLNIAKNYPFTEKLQARMVKDLRTRYPKDELTWDAMARCELEGTHYVEGQQALIGPKKAEADTKAQDSNETEISETKMTPEQIVRQRILSCCHVYELGLQHLGTERMWSLYLDTLLHLNRDPGSLRNFKRKLLREALQKGHAEGRLEENYYLQWAGLYSNKKKELANVLRAATERHTKSVALWEMRLHFHLSRGEEDTLMAIFKLAVACLGSTTSAALPLWKMLIQYWQTKNINKVEEIFREGITQGPAISDVLKPMFLEWLVLAKDVSISRQVYQSICNKPPFCKEAHMKMAELENLLPEVDMARVVKCYELACEQFGRDHVSVWMEYIKFERQRGDPKKVKEVYRRALSSLHETLAHSFINEFCEYWVIKDL